MKRGQSYFAEIAAVLVLIIALFVIVLVAIKKVLP